MQTTFLMLKPDAFESKNVEVILGWLEEAGLLIEVKNVVEVNLDVMKVLIDHYGPVIDSMDPSFDFAGKLFNSFYYHGPRYVMPMRVSYCGEEDIIHYTRALVGATNPKNAKRDTIRGALSSDNYEMADKDRRLVNNLIHASDSLANKERELALWKHYLQET